MECCDLAINFLNGRKGRKLKALLEQAGFEPITGILVDYDDDAMLLEIAEGQQVLIDLDFVVSLADVTGE